MNARILSEINTNEYWQMLRLMDEDRGKPQAAEEDCKTGQRQRTSEGSPAVSNGKHL